MLRLRDISGKFVFGCGLTLAVLVPLAPAHAFKVIHSFASGTDGANPAGALSMDKAGNLYGTTVFGGNKACNGGQGCGTLFQLAPDGTESLWESFYTDGDMPKASVLRDSSSNLYCTVSSGGASSAGAVFKIASSGKEKMLYTFSGGSGSTPVSSLVIDASGNLYGTTSAGGDAGGGTIFELSPNGTETTLHSFLGSDGYVPEAGLISDSSGNFYGTASEGGVQGVGTIFKLASDGTYSLLYSFNGGTLDGENPYGGVIRDGTGNLYGTTRFGGNVCSTGCGTVFKFGSNGKETLLHNFAGGSSDGALPVAGLVRDKSGNLYGTTQFGGGTGCSGQVAGCGVVFKLAPDGTETILYAFTGGNDGGEPTGGLIAKNGVLYGTASIGGAKGFGAVFMLNE